MSDHDAEGWLSASPAISHGRFPPGTLLLKRYRVVNLLGKGGMGEVYRADDLKLGQQVALKFLPPALAHDPELLRHLHLEVRLARQIAHPNVCRVYDAGEVDGNAFISMEYIDGEDLDSLLRRIGRLPEDKALEISRQFCAGVAAAHRYGVLHRDLKPANIMIDGRGNVRIADFGLAIAAGTTDDITGGTPCYMAPEQITDGEVSVKSDIYAVGLVLYEVFTGRRAIHAHTFAQLVEWHQSHTLTPPSELVPGLDPVIERAILRCVEKTPEDRPASALAVVTALLGGDPLAAAAATGDTPSPDMVATAGREDALPTRIALVSLAGMAVLLAMLAAVSDRVLLLHAIPPPKAVDVLVDRAEAIRAALGYTDTPRDRYYQLEAATDHLRHIEETDASNERWQLLRRGRPAAIHFWYRASPLDLIRYAPGSRPTLEDPPPTVAGMTTVITDTQGRLLEFNAVTAERDAGAAPAGTPDWAPLFAAAELPFSSFTSVTPTWMPRTFADTRAAWEGAVPEDPATRLRVEAAAYGGRPVFFQVVGPWSRPANVALPPRRTFDVVLSVLATTMLLALVGAAAWLARQHLLHGRGDRRGADRVALFSVLAYTATWVFGAHHFAGLDSEANSLFLNAAIGVLQAGIVWLFYLALEPVVRKWRPRALVGWTRLVAGGIRDAHVGRDVLIGAAAGTLFALLRTPRGLLPLVAGLPPASPVVTSFAPLVGFRETLGVILQLVPSAISSAMLLLFVYVVAHMLFRRTWLAVGVVCVAVTLIAVALRSGPGQWMELGLVSASLLLLLLAVVRFGLLAAVVMFLVDTALEAMPLTANRDQPYFAASMWILAGVFGLAAFGAYAARGGARAEA